MEKAQFYVLNSSQLQDQLVWYQRTESAGSATNFQIPPVEEEHPEDPAPSDMKCDDGKGRERHDEPILIYGPLNRDEELIIVDFGYDSPLSPEPNDHDMWPLD